MTLGAGLIDAAGQRHAMLGLLGLETDFAQRRLHLGYRTATLLAPIPGHAAGSALRGHEFHYARVVAQPDEPLADIRDASGVATAETGSRRGHVTGSFFHMVDASTEGPIMTASDATRQHHPDRRRSRRYRSADAARGRAAARRRCHPV